MPFLRAALLTSAIWTFSSVPGLSGPLDGVKSVRLVAPDGAETLIAEVAFTPDGDGDGDGATYEITMKDAPFTDHFLSMRPFRCLEGDAKHWCHVPYPYEIRRRVSADDLTDLEYDLLFLWKGATEYGINMWNGVYYRLAVDGDRLIGRLHEMDMDTLSAPPDDGDLRPVRDADLEESDPESHWLPVVVVE